MRRSIQFNSTWHRLQRLTEMWLRHMLLLSLIGCFSLERRTDLGERYLGKGDYGKAIEAFTALPKSSERNQLLARAHRSQAARLLKLEDCAGGFGHLEKAATLEERVKLDYQLAHQCFTAKSASIPIELARYLHGTGDVRTSILSTLLSDAVKLAQFSQANQLARTLAARNIVSEAQARWLVTEAGARDAHSDARYWLLKLVERNPRNAYYITRLAITCSRLRDDDRAHRYFAAASMFNPNNPILLSEWKHVCQRRGDLECVHQIDQRSRTEANDRKLRPLLKSRR